MTLVIGCHSSVTAAGQVIDGDVSLQDAPYVPRAVTPIPLPWEQETAPDCGANALYLYLKLAGQPVAFHDVRNKVTHTGKGASMLELKDVATEYGVETRVVECSASDIRAFELPVIARLAPGEDPQVGHYVVVVGFDDNSVRIIDGTAGDFISTSFRTFERNYSGYVLLRGKRSLSTFKQALGGVVVFQAIWLFCLLFRIGRKTRARQMDQSQTIPSRIRSTA